MKPELKKMNRKQLEDLKSKISKQLDRLEEKRKDEALRAIEGVCASYGYPLEDILKRKKTKKPKAQSRPSTPRYRNPDNPEQTWSGFGRRPGWIQTYLDEGGSLDHFLIKPPS